MSLNLPIPTFFSEDLTAIVTDCKAYIESLLNKTISPADPEQLLINGFAYREYLKNIQANETARQNLLAFAVGNMLDYLAELDDVYRLPSSSAQCTVVFILNDGHSDITIPAGVRIQTIDQKIIFITTEAITILSGTNTGSVTANATTAGTDGNDYAIGKVSLLLDPQPYVISVSNSDVTTGGADQETDDQLRQRIVDAKSSYSVAGPTKAYEYFAKTAHPSIIDVKVAHAKDGSDIDIPGTVKIYPLLKGGQLPSDEILADVLAICNADTVRPLNDIVSVAAPTKTDYAIEVQLTLYTTAVQTVVEQQVNDALAKYVVDGLNKLGRDIKKSQIAALCMIQGQVYDVAIVQPSSDIVADDSVYTNNTGITVTTIGTNNG